MANLCLIKEVTGKHYIFGYLLFRAGSSEAERLPLKENVEIAKLSQLTRMKIKIKRDIPTILATCFAEILVFGLWIWTGKVYRYEIRRIKKKK